MKVNEEAWLAAKLAQLSINTHVAALDAGKLKAMARSHRRLMEQACNQELSGRETARVQKLRKTITDIAADYKITVSFHGDPRGYTVYLHFPDGRGNTWGGDETGWGI